MPEDKNCDNILPHMMLLSDEQLIMTAIFNADTAMQTDLPSSVGCLTADLEACWQTTMDT